MSRAKLVRRLVGSRRVPVVGIVAQAGYGKTSLIAQWDRKDRRPFAWVSIDERDNDPVVLLRYAATALARVVPIDRSVFDALAAPGKSIWSSIVPKLGAALLSVSDPVVLVLDGVHFLRHQASFDAVTALAQHVPPGSQLVLAGRTAQKLPFASWRAESRLLEVGVDELRMNSQEARVLLRSAGVQLDQADVNELTQHTEGWAAALYLAALSIQAEGSETGAVASFGGADRFIADYLRAKHLSGLSKRKVQFLTRTAVLGSMCAPLCDAVLERTDSRRALDSLEEANLFLVPLDRRGEWYRYHHLFRELLVAELDRREPGLPVELSRRAADWCEANSDYETAIEYARAAGDIDRVARLVTMLALPTHYAGRFVTVERWLAAFDEDGLIKQYPAVGVLGAWIHSLRGRPALADRWGDLAEQGTFEGTLPDGSPSIESWRAILRAARGRSGLEQMRADAEVGLNEIAETSPWRPVALLLVAGSHLLAGDDDVADDLFARTAEVATAVGAQGPRRIALAERVLLAMDRGRLDEAEQLMVDAHALVDSAALSDYTTTTIVLAANARIALRRGDSATARASLMRAQRLRHQLTYALPWFAAQTLLELARANLALTDIAGAKTLLADADEIIRLRPGLGVLVDQARQLRDQIGRTSALEARWAAAVTAAELRLIPLLTTHLSFREIAELLYVSRNTVKAQAISLYRKLGVSSRSEAIQRAAELGLVDAPVIPVPDDFILSG